MPFGIGIGVIIGLIIASILFFVKTNPGQRIRQKIGQYIPMPRIFNAYSDNGTFSNIGTLISQSTTDDTILNLYGQQFDRNRFRYYVIDKDGQKIWINNGEPITELEHDAVLTVPGKESVGSFIVQKTSTQLLYQPLF